LVLFTHIKFITSAFNIVFISHGDQYHSPQHGTMSSSINMVDVVCVVVSAFLLLPYRHENILLANGRAKHLRLLSEVQTYAK
jgi:hypothetical protein